jgi:hypothetical protein
MSVLRVEGRRHSGESDHVLDLLALPRLWRDLESRETGERTPRLPPTVVSAHDHQRAGSRTLSAAAASPSTRAMHPAATSICASVAAV